MPAKAGIQTEVLWIPAGVYPRLDSRFRGNDKQRGRE